MPELGVPLSQRVELEKSVYEDVNGTVLVPVQESAETPFQVQLVPARGSDPAAASAEVICSRVSIHLAGPDCICAHDFTGFDSPVAVQSSAVR